jgi:hypothetical protein
MPLGGWGGWNYALGIAQFLQESGIKVYCVLDRDFHLPQEVDERKAQAAKAGIQLHVWSKKEIENFFLIPDVIVKVIASRIKGSGRPSVADITAKLDDLAQAMKESVIDSFADSFRLLQKGIELKTAMKRARSYIAPFWTTPEGRLAVVGGKDLFADLSNWCTDEFDVSVGVMAVLRDLSTADVPIEIRSVLDAVAASKDF